MPHGRQIKSFQYLQGLRERRTLAPRTSAIDVISLVIDRHCRTHRHLVVGQVFRGEHPAQLLVEGHDLATEFAGVDIVSGGL